MRWTKRTLINYWSWKNEILSKRTQCDVKEIAQRIYICLGIMKN